VEAVLITELAEQAVRAVVEQEEILILQVLLEQLILAVAVEAVVVKTLVRGVTAVQA
jgi:hypothetical protein